MSQHHIDIHHVARLARLKLTDTEATIYGSQLGKILDYIAALNDHNLSAADPTAHASPVFDVWREDEPRESFSNDQALANAPKKSQAQFLMPRVVEE